LETKSYQEEITLLKLFKKNSNWDNVLKVGNLSLLFPDWSSSFKEYLTELFHRHEKKYVLDL
jgi:hypothetical protein